MRRATARDFFSASVSFGSNSKSISFGSGFVVVTDPPKIEIVQKGWRFEPLFRALDQLAMEIICQRLNPLAQLFRKGR